MQQELPNLVLLPILSAHPPHLTSPPPTALAMMTTAFPRSRPCAKEAVPTYPADEWGPDETLHAWEIVMFNHLLMICKSPWGAVLGVCCSPFPAVPARQTTKKRKPSQNLQVGTAR